MNDAEREPSVRSGCFEGVPLAALDFFEDLEADNSRPYWLAHKHIYDESVRAPLEALTAELAHEFGAAKVFRPYRDVRFAKDKTPYKTHQGAVVQDGPSRASLYLHVDAAGLFVAGGRWHLESAEVDRYRRAVADDVAGSALERVLQRVRRARFDIGGHRLTRVPSGYPREHPRGDLLRHRSLVAQRSYGAPDWLTSPRARTEIAKAWRSLAPLNDWLDTHVGGTVGTSV